MYGSVVLASDEANDVYNLSTKSIKLEGYRNGSWSSQIVASDEYAKINFSPLHQSNTGDASVDFSDGSPSGAGVVNLNWAGRPSRVVVFVNSPTGVHPLLVDKNTLEKGKEKETILKAVWQELREIVEKEKAKIKPWADSEAHVGRKLEHLRAYGARAQEGERKLQRAKPAATPAPAAASSATTEPEKKGVKARIKQFEGAGK